MQDHPTWNCAEFAEAPVNFQEANDTVDRKPHCSAGQELFHVQGKSLETTRIFIIVLSHMTKTQKTHSKTHPITAPMQPWVGGYRLDTRDT